MTTQLAIRIEDALADQIDALVPSRFANRTEIVRAALVDFLDRERRAAIGRQIAEGYSRVPMGDDPWSNAVSREAASAQEPW